MEKEEESVSLMHDEDLEELGIDDSASTKTVPKAVENNDKKSETPKPSLKRHREEEGDESSEDKKKASDSDVEQSSSGLKMIKRRRLLKKKETKNESEADDSDKILDDWIQEENKDPILSSSSSDDEEGETEDAGKSKEPQKVNVTDAEPLARIQNALFGSQDDDLFNDDDEPHKPVPDKGGDEDVEMKDVDDNADTTAKDADGPIPIVITDDSIPVESRGMDIGVVRCTYAANPIIEGWSPFTLETSDNTVDGITIDENAILTMPWGVYCNHGGSGDGNEGKYSRKKHLEFIKENVARKLAEVPWFVLMASEQVLRYMASPFFTYKIRVLRVDPVRVKFAWRHEVPIFYVVGLDEKTPLWPSDAVWQPIQLQRLIVDTLYAHLEKEGHNKGHELEEKVKKVLINIGEFPLPVNKPYDTLLPPHDVAMNNYSLRSERVDRIKELFTNQFKAAISPAVVTPMQAKCVDSTPLSHIAARYITNADYIFMDLEKPYHIWNKYVVEGGIPVDVVSRVSYWAKHKIDEVVQRFMAFDVFVDRSKDTARSIWLKDHLKLREYVAFSPDWFDGWFRHVRQASNREERKSLYAFFAACHLWRQAQEDSERYGSVSTYLFTKARREFLFEHGFVWCDANLAHILRLTKQNDSRPRFDPLVPSEIDDVMRQIVDVMSDFNNGYDKQPYHIKTDDTGLITSTAAINSDRYDTSSALAKFIMLIALQWKMCRSKIEPRSLRYVSPLVVQCATVYGTKSGNSPDELYADLQKSMGSSLVMLIIRPYSSKQELIKFLNTERDSRKLGSNPPHVIVFDRFHNWSLDIIGVCLRTIKQLNLESKCTNLIVTGFAHCMGCVNGGGSMIWELIEIAERLDSELQSTLRSKDSPNEKSISSMLFDKNSIRWKYSQKGLLSEQHYTFEEREEQLLANDQIFVMRKTSNLEMACKALVTTLDKKKCKTVVVLYARYTTYKRMVEEIKKLNHAILTITPVPIHFISYREIEHKTAMMANRDLIVLADIDYKGANRPSYLHINSAFEHARSGIVIIGDKLSSVGAEDRPLELLKDVFHRSDEKSDRHLMNLGRCPIVKEKFDRFISASKVSMILRASGERVTSASPLDDKD